MLDFAKLFLLPNDVQQILDILQERMLIWRATAEYLETGYLQSADCMEECDDGHEARAIIDYHKYLINTIEGQLKRNPHSKKYLYINLIHGRKDPNQRLSNWGFDGPTLGPYTDILCTYCTDLRLIKINGEVDILDVYDNLVFYDKNYYGDWCISTEVPLGKTCCYPYKVV